MALQSRFLQKIFGSTGGTSEFGKIGSEAAGSPATTKDLDLIQSLSQYLGGLYDITAAANEPPRIQDINALYFLITSQLSYLFQNGISKYLSTEEYYVGSVIVDSNSNLYISIYGTDGDPNLGNTPSSSPTYWRLLVDYAGALNKAVAGEINAMSAKTSLVDADEFVIEDSADSNNKKKVAFSTIQNNISTSSIVTSAVNYNIADTLVSGSTIIANPNTASQYGQLIVTLPTLADNIGKRFIIKFGSAGNANGGLVKIVPETPASEKLLLDDAQISLMYLFQKGDSLEVFNDGTDWVIERINSNLNTGWKNRSDWTGAEMGLCPVTYDNLSGTVLIGSTVTETGGNACVGVVLYDSGTQVLLYGVQNGGVFANNNALTFSNGATALVNEVSGNNKDQLESMYYGLGLNVDYLDIIWWTSTDGTYANSDLMRNGSSQASTNRAQGLVAVDTNNCKIISETNAMMHLPSSKALVALTTQDQYIKIIARIRR